MSTMYEPPEWGLKGSNVFNIYADVIKGGMVIETLKLPMNTSKSYVVVGRMEPVCDLVLYHPSISRVHAVLQFDIHGALFIRDMNSTYGTFVNKKRIPSNTFERLHIGDLVIWGESTRMYAICGPSELLPEEYNSVNLEAFRKRLEQKKNQESIGVSWGFQEDAEEEEEEEEKEDKDVNLPDYLRNVKQVSTTSLNASDIDEKDQKLFTQLQNRKMKIENLEMEKARILAKQDSLQGLTDGQQKQLERNTTRIEALVQEIERLEAQLEERKTQREKSRQGMTKNKSICKVKKKEEQYDSDDDDFYDRTKPIKSNQQANTMIKKNQVLTADMLEEKVNTLQRQLDQVSAEYEQAVRIVADEKTNDQEVDALDAYMQTANKEMHQKDLQSLRDKRRVIEMELQTQQQLLKIARPALEKRTESTSAGVPKSTENLSAEKSTSCVPHDPKETETESVIENTRTETVELKQVQDETPIQPSGDTVPPNGDCDTVPIKKRRVVGPTRPSSVSTTKIVDPTRLEGGERVWIPPSNQTGDGRTRLNDKYGY